MEVILNVGLLYSVEAFSYFNKKINQSTLYYLSSDVTNDIITRTS